MTEAQKPDRRKFIGGSDIAALLGIAPKTWERNSPVSLYFDKVEPPKDNGTNKREKRRGHLWEEMAGKMLIQKLTDPEFTTDGKEHKVEVLARNKRYIDPHIPHFACEIDMEILIDDDPEIVNVELKTVHPFKTGDWGEEETDQSPIWYTSQVQWGLGITGHRKAIIAPLFGADEIKVFPMSADTDLIRELRLRANSFWVDHVVKRIPPDPTSLIDLSQLYPKDQGETIELKHNQKFVDAIVKLNRLALEWKEMETEYEKLEQLCKEQMGTAAIATIGGDPACTWKTQSDARIDVKMLRSKYPVIADECTDKNRTKRVFLLKQPKKGKK